MKMMGPPLGKMKPGLGTIKMLGPGLGTIKCWNQD